MRNKKILFLLPSPLLPFPSASLAEALVKADVQNNSNQPRPIKMQTKNRPKPAKKHLSRLQSGGKNVFSSVEQNGVLRNTTHLGGYALPSQVLLSETACKIGI